MPRLHTRLTLHRVAFFLAALLPALAAPPAVHAQTSAIEVLDPNGVWTTCGLPTVASPSTIVGVTPSPAVVGSPVTFQIRKISGPFPSESLDVRSTVTRVPLEDEPAESLALSQVGFRSSPPLPQRGLRPGTLPASITFTPPRTGVYQFEFFSLLWDGGVCRIDVPVSETGCFLTAVTGIGPSGNAAAGVLDFEVVPVGVRETGQLRLAAMRNWAQGDQFRFNVTQPVDPAFDAPSGGSASGREATAMMGFTPDRPGLFESRVQIVGRPGGVDDPPACWRDLILRGTGGAPQLTIEFEGFSCGATPEAIVVLGNEGVSRIDDLDARVSAGFLIPNPAGSFRADNFSLGPAGSTNPPSERRFTYRYPSSGSGGAVTVQQGSTQLVSQAVPAAPPCIEIVDPAQLTLDFGDVVVGTTAPGRSIVLRNLGDAAAAVTATLASTGPSQGFAIGAGASSVQLDLPARGSASLPVGFRPASLGLKTSRVSFTGPGLQIADVRLRGAAVQAPAVNLTFSAQGSTVGPGGLIPFPQAKVGESMRLDVLITNNSTTQAAGLTLTASGDYALAGAFPGTLEAGAGATQTIVFTPRQPGLRRGTLTVAGAGLSAPATVGLEGEGLPGDVNLSFTGLTPVVAAAQVPAPAVGVEVSGGAPAEALEGDLLLDFFPDTPQGVGPQFESSYAAVRFMSGDGPLQRSIPFRIEAGQNRATFPSEQDAEAQADVARFQTGSVAGNIRFRLANLRTSSGTPVGSSGGLESTVQVPRSAPQASLTMNRTGAGADLVVDIVTTTREVTGVCVLLSAAAEADLEFQRPPPNFAAGPLGDWFSNTDSYMHGGGLTLTIPVSVDQQNVLGSAQVWIENGQGWSSTGSPCP